MSARDAEYTEYVAARLSSLRRLAVVLCDDWQRADYLVQATLTKLYVHWGRAREARHADAYARAVLVREFIHERRSNWARRVTLRGGLPDTPAAAMDHDAVLDVRTAVAALPARQRATLVLRFYCDMSPNPPTPAWRAQALKVADHVRYGPHAAPPLAFPVQLFAVPAAWRVSAVTYVPHGRVSQASEYSLAASPAALYPSGLSEPGLPHITITLAGARNSCLSMPHSVHKVVRGYQVVVANVPASSHGPQEPGQFLCAANADGLMVNIKVLGRHPVLGVVSLFAHHMALLGPHPARWYSLPILRPVRIG